MGMLDDLNRQLDMEYRKLRRMKGLGNIGIRRQIRKNIQALEEAQRDVTSTAVASLQSSITESPTKSNYTTYESQVNKAYEMYEGRSSFGSELFATSVDTRTAFIGGEGIAVEANGPVKKFIKKFIEDNELNGHRLLDIITTGELEGKNLLQLEVKQRETGLFKDLGQKYITFKQLLWPEYKYNVKNDGLDTKEVTYKDDNDRPRKFDMKRTVYVQIGRPYYNDADKTPTRLHKIITDFENFSRGKYDLRTNTNLFGRVMPTFKTDTREDAKAVKATLEESEWDIGDGYVGPAQVTLLEPSGSAGKSIIDDVTLAMKIVSANTGIPVHWLAWPELMSNRATAENLMEVVNAATRHERLIWERKLKELIQKAMVIAVDENIEDNGILNSDFTIHLPFVSLALLAQVASIWLPLWESELISGQTMVNTLPGSIDYDAEQKQIKKEKEEKAKQSQLNNDTVNNAIDRMQQGAEDDTDENGEQQAGAKRDVPVPADKNQPQRA